jgi:uncharacterized protein
MMMRCLSIFSLTCACLFLAPIRIASSGDLSTAASPYLLSHATDLIEWQVWEPGSLKRAAQQDRLIFLSIGYLSCHWCHRMARDTFSDPRIAELLNTRFVPILADRETRPDLDEYYMEVMQGMLGWSGWPANFILTPDGVPLFVTGYTKPDASQGDPGLLTVLSTLATEWTKNRSTILTDVEITREQLKAHLAPRIGGVELNALEARETVAESWAKRIDEEYGGFGQSSKFPQPNALLFLIDHGVRTGDDALLRKIYKTLDHMAAGGVRDQIGGTFHRYAVDRFWQVPHFEIMLNDNALLARVYLRAFQVSNRPRYRDVAREILDDLIARFHLSAGGFSSSLGAYLKDSEKNYYTWTANDVRAALGATDAAAFIDAYVDSEHGLVDGRSVLRLRSDPRTFQKARGRFLDHFARLRTARAVRPAPKRDDKLLISWNALAVSAFALAAKVLDDPDYGNIAQRTAGHLIRLSDGTSGLRHSYHGSNASREVFLEDYAFFIEALIDLYEFDFDSAHLDRASELMEGLRDRFETPKRGLFLSTVKQSGSILPKRFILREDGMPSGNAAALSALYRLELFSEDEALSRRALAFVSSVGQRVIGDLAAAPSTMNVLGYGSDEAHEIVIVGNADDPETKNLLKEVYKRPIRSTVLSVIPASAPAKNAKWPLLSGRPLLSDKSTAYVCRRRLCKLPVDTAEALARQLDQIVFPKQVTPSSTP